MFATLFVDGDPAGLTDDTLDTISLVFDTDYGPTHRCRTCGEPLIETTDGYETETGESTCTDVQPVTDTDDMDGGHHPERIPLSWCNSAAVHTDESQDSVTVSISVGDPRGAFTPHHSTHPGRHRQRSSRPIDHAHPLSRTTPVPSGAHTLARRNPCRRALPGPPATSGAVRRLDPTPHPRHAVTRHDTPWRYPR